MKISSAEFLQEDVGYQKLWVGSKKSVQKGRSHFWGRSVLAIREHGKMARTPLAAFFNRPKRGKASFHRHRRGPLLSRITVIFFSLRVG